MILEIAISLVAVAGFAVVLWWSRIVSVARKAMSMTTEGLSAMMDSDLDDDAKETALRRAGFGLILAAFNIFWRFAAALAAAAAPIYLADAIGLATSETVFALMLRLDYIVIVSVVAIVLAEIIRRMRPSDAESTPDANRYSTADRFFHILAFSSPVVLKSASWIEDRVTSRPVSPQSAPPVFITSLARGGTTALLNAFHDIPGIATHTYRDMPFLTAPSLWNRLAGGQKRAVARHQRAHGDGLEIDLNSPEAFEEVIWKMFWPEKFQTDAIALWQDGDRKAEAEEFLRQHLSKVIRAREIQGAQHDDGMRYCSKNNANIARLSFLKQTFPECRIVVPVRRPESHAASLLRQHRNFLKLQAEDDFIKRYMRDIGHFEFGLLHKPIRFPGFDAKAYDPATDDYWLNYWIHSFRFILEHGDICTFVLQDDLRSAPQETMQALCDRLDVAHDGMDFTSYYRPTPDKSRTDLYDPALYDEAADLYRDFEKHAVGV